MKNCKKLFSGILVTVFLMAAASISVLAGYEERIHMIFGLDASGNVRTASAGVVLIDLDTYYVMTDSSILAEDIEEYIYIDNIAKQQYRVDYAATFDGTEIILLSFQEEVPPRESLVQVGAAQKDQIVNMAYLDQNGERKGCKFRFTEAHAGAAEGITELDGTVESEFEDDEPIFFYPIIFIDDNGTLFAMASDDKKILSVSMDADSFYGASNNEDAEEDDQNAGTEDNKGTSAPSAGRPGRTDDADNKKSELLSDLISGGLIGAVAGFIVLMCKRFLGKKKDKRINVDPVTPTSPIPPTPTPVSEPIPERISIPKPEVSGISIKIVGTAGVMQGRSYEMGKEDVSVGRDISCMIRFPAETKGVSKVHCKLFWSSQGVLMIMDCGSSYGTYLKGYGKLPEKQPVPIKSGDTFCLGSEKIAFVIQC